MGKWKCTSISLLLFNLICDDNDDEDNDNDDDKMNDDNNNTDDDDEPQLVTHIMKAVYSVLYL